MEGREGGGTAPPKRKKTDGRTFLVDRSPKCGLKDGLGGLEIQKHVNSKSRY